MTYRTRGLTVLALGFFWSTANAQTVERDSTTGDYLIHYQSEGATHTIQVAARDRIEPSIRLTGIEASATGFVYTYRFLNASGGRAVVGRGYSMVDLDCAADAPARSNTGQPAGWRMYTGTASDGSKVCMFRGRRFLEPGDSVSGFVVTTATLPRIGTADVYGRGVIPTVDEEAIPDTVSALLDDLSVRGVTVPAIVPGRPAESLSDASASLTALNGDLGQVCADDGWVRNVGICRSLTAKLEAVAGALVRRNLVEARNQAGALLSELDAQRGKAVPEEAYLLLTLIGKRLTDQLH